MKTYEKAVCLICAGGTMQFVSSDLHERFKQTENIFEMIWFGSLALLVIFVSLWAFMRGLFYLYQFTQEKPRHSKETSSDA